MDKLLLKAIPPATNGTQPTDFDFSPNVLNTLIPGYSIISHYASTYLGIDISQGQNLLDWDNVHMSYPINNWLCDQERLDIKTSTVDPSLFEGVPRDSKAYGLLFISSSHNYAPGADPGPLG